MPATSLHDALDNTTMPTHYNWEKRAVVTGSGTPITVKYISKRHHTAGIHARLIQDVKQFHLSRRKFRELGWAIESKEYVAPKTPYMEAKTQCWTKGALKE